MLTPTPECCPQCGREVDSIRVRLVQDSCGHTKCRPCLLSEEAGCAACLCSPQYTDLRPVQSPLQSSLSNFDSETLPLLPSSDHLASEDSAMAPTSLHIDNIIQPELNSLTSLKSQSPTIENAEIIEDNDVINSSDEGSSKEKKRPMFGLKEHIVFTPGDPPKYFCKHCQKSYNNRKAARYHNYCGAANSEKPHTCDICGQGFVTKGHFAYHMKSHTGSLPFICKICGKGFKQLSKLNRHSKSHEEKLEKPFKCNKCEKAFSTKHILKDHMVSHSEGLSLPCPICSKKLSSKSCLRKHKKLHAEPTHKCKDCEKKFSVKWSLEVHQRTHLRERKFKCRLCNRAFKLQRDLTRHGIVHQDDGEWGCKICHLVFRRRDNLVRHIKNIHPESSPKISVKQGKVKDVDVNEGIPQNDGNLSAASTSLSHAVSVIRTVPVIQKPQTVAVNVYTPPLESSSSGREEGHSTDRKTPMDPNNLQESNKAISADGKTTTHLAASNDQNYHRESVVCHYDSRGIVHHGSVSNVNVIKSSSSGPAVSVVEYENEFQETWGNQSISETENHNSQTESIQRPRVIVAQKPICDNT